MLNTMFLNENFLGLDYVIISIIHPRELSPQSTHAYKYTPTGSDFVSVEFEENQVVLFAGIYQILFNLYGLYFVNVSLYRSLT